MERLESHHRVPDASVTVRNGRYVIPVRRGGQVVAGGIVHDASATGGTLFVEPAAAVEFGNRIRELEYEEVAEVDRILLALTDTLRPHRDAMIATLAALVELDSLFARSRFADVYQCAAARFVERAGGIRDPRRAPSAPARPGSERRPVRPRDDGGRTDPPRVRAEHRRQDRAAQSPRVDLGARAIGRARAGRCRVAHPALRRRLRRRGRRAVDRGEPLHVQRARQEPRRDSAARDAGLTRPRRRARVGHRSAPKARRSAGRFSRTSPRAARSRWRRPTSARSRSLPAR